MTKTSLLALFAGVALAGLAHAQVSGTVPAAEESAFDPAICTEKAAENTTVIANWAAAADDAAREAVLRPALAGEDNWNALCLMLAATQDQQLALLEDLIDVLNENQEVNAPVIAALMDTYGDLVAQRVAGTETAAGGGTNATFGNPGGNPGENPNQLNPQDDDDESSPELPPAPPAPSQEVEQNF